MGTGIKMSSELDDDWRPEVSAGLVDYETPELGSSPNKMLHVVYRVGNMDRTIKFYKEVFGMEVRMFRVPLAMTHVPLRPRGFLLVDKRSTRCW